MEIKEKFPLKKLNTFGISATAGKFVAVQTTEQLKQVLPEDASSVRILGGGSNVLITGDVPDLVIKNEIGGVEVKADGHYTLVSAGAGVNWHELVLFTLENQLSGLENLSLIPGCTGAAPIQNIGAYGVELKDVFHHLEALNLETFEIQVFDKEACQFGYRDSIFKNALKGKFCITKVVLQLSGTAQLNTSYGDILRTLEEMGIEHPSPKDVSNAVIHIRQSKLPDPSVIGNAGSFFKNPEIEVSHFQELRKKYPGIVHFEMPNGRIKVPAGWLIEQSGWKGKRFGDAGCHAKQALVLVNYGNATGGEVLDLALKIQASVKEIYGIDLTPEVNIW